VRWAITFFFLTAFALLMPIRLVAAPHAFPPEAVETVSIAFLGAVLFCLSILVRRHKAQHPGTPSAWGAILTPRKEAGIIEPVSSPRYPAQAARANHSPTWKKRTSWCGAPPTAERHPKRKRRCQVTTASRVR
jgi:hypothetical protein